MVGTEPVLADNRPDSDHSCLTCGAQTYHISGWATPAGITQVHALMDLVRADHPELPRHDLLLFETAMIELANNVVEHGRPQGQVYWRMLFNVSPRALEAELIDTSEAATFTVGRPMPGVEATGGRGIPIIEAALDYLLLTRVGEENHWLLLRMLPG